MKGTDRFKAQEAVQAIDPSKDQGAAAQAEDQAVAQANVREVVRNAVRDIVHAFWSFLDR